MTFEDRLEWLKSQHETLITKKNRQIEGNGVYERYDNPVLTADHARAGPLMCTPSVVPKCQL